MKTFILGLTVFCVSSLAKAGDIEWSGTYRIEGVKLENAEMNDVERNKQYILHHLVLNPKITAYDGLTIYGRFDIMNSAAYPQSQVGQFFGSGLSGGDTSDNNAVLSDRQSADMIAVNHLYLTYVQEFGMLTVGRAPLQFGLGMSYNAGNGAFDHWFDNRDLVSFKVSMGNLSFMPMMAKVVESDIGYEDDINDYMFQVMYENPDTELKLGAVYRLRKSTRAGNTAPGSPVFGGATPPVYSDGYDGQFINLFFQRWVGESFKIGLEAATQKGDAGVTSAAGPVTMDGFGVALEMDWIPKTSSFHAGLKAGVASGDDPNTVNVYEGFTFDRNYDVAFLLFNHPLGQYDIFRNAANRNTVYTGPNQFPSSLIDVEAISNVIYIAPHFKYKWTDTLDSQLGITYAQLSGDPLTGIEVDKSVGFEVDMTLNYKPFDNVQWLNRVGIFSPGAAFQGGTNNFETKTMYGLETKAAITF